MKAKRSTAQAKEEAARMQYSFRECASPQALPNDPLSMGAQPPKNFERISRSAGSRGSVA